MLGKKELENPEACYREYKLSGVIYSPSGSKLGGDIPESVIVTPVLKLRWDLCKASALLWQDSC